MYGEMDFLVSIFSKIIYTCFSRCQTMASEQPMPSDPSEVDAKFAEVVEELDLPPAQRQQMFALPLEKKWQLYCSRKKVCCSLSNEDDSRVIQGFRERLLHPSVRPYVRRWLGSYLVYTMVFFCTLK